MARFLIFLPVHNGSRYIRSTIDSVLQQSVTDWELVVLENGSTDATRSIVESFRDPRVRLFCEDRNLGIVDNWARISQLLQDGTVGGEFATLIGHDDRLYPDFLAGISSLQTQYPAAGLYQTAFDLIDSDGQRTRPCRPIPEQESAEEFLTARARGLRDSFGTGYVFRTSDYLRVGGMPALPRLIFADDLLWARLARERGKVCTSRTLCAYRLHAQSVSGGRDLRQLTNHLDALARFLALLDVEFADHMTSASGRAAVGQLLAHHAQPFWSAPLRWLMPPSSAPVLEALASRYRAIGGLYPPAAGSDDRSGTKHRLRHAVRTALWAMVLARGRLT